MIKPFGLLVLSQAFLPGGLLAQDWPMYLRDLTHSSFNASESTLTRDNLRQLQPAWLFDAGAAFAAAPSIVNGIAYVGAWDGQFFAIDAQTGSELWRSYVGIAPSPANPRCSPPLGVTSQAVVVGDTVYVGGGDSAVYALDKRSGELRLRIPLADPASGSYIWSSMLAHGNVLYAGVASLGGCPMVRGALFRIDLNTPDQPLVRYLAPEDQVGGGVWSTPAIDESTNRIYITTGSGEQNPESGQWGGTMLVLDATTLEIQATFLLPSNSVIDNIEWGTSPTLFHDYEGTLMVAASGKDGVIYAVRAADLSPVWERQIGVRCGCPQCGCGSVSSPAFDGEVLYAAGGGADPQNYRNGTVYALNPSTGLTIWSVSLPGVVLAPVTVANGIVFVASTAGLVALDALHGTPLWNQPPGFGSLYSQAVVTGGTVYCTYLDGAFIAWRLP